MIFYFSSADSPSHNWKLMKGGAQYRMTTYFRFDGALAAQSPSPSLALSGRDPNFIESRDRACKLVIERSRAEKDVKSWVVDSGAHSYQKPRYKVPLEALRAYRDRYIDFCVDAGDLFNWCAEMDVENVYGQRFVEECWEKMIDAGVRALRVWHVSRGVEAFKRYCLERRDVGIGGPWPDRKDVVSMLKWAYFNGNRIHIFGVLRDELLKLPCYSCDAISWLSPEAWGQVIKFDKSKGKLIRISPRKTGLTMNALREISACREIGYDAATISTIQELLEYEKYVTESWALRGIEFDSAKEPKWIKCEVEDGRIT